MYYHRNCRSSFTHKKTLEGSLVGNEESTSGTEMRKSTRETSNTNTSRGFNHICIFYEKKNKYSKGSKSAEPLIQSRELRSNEQIRNAAIANLNWLLLRLTTRSSVIVTTPEEKSRSPLLNRHQTTTLDIRLLNRKHIICCAPTLETPLLSHVQTIILTTLTDRLVLFMATLDYTSDQVKQQTKKHIRRKLEREFNDFLHVVCKKNGRVLVFPDNLFMTNVMIENER